MGEATLGQAMARDSFISISQDSAGRYIDFASKGLCYLGKQGQRAARAGAASPGPAQPDGRVASSQLRRLRLDGSDRGHQNC
ncbi:MAG: hypothetical protein BWY85_00912 [Firmicutes bacterium ADurb.Bin506]|nr:MAG: hypothetical protein BWY85_00912 [Firmicutes bacterium ADurb.Bin506]